MAGRCFSKQPHSSCPSPASHVCCVTKGWRKGIAVPWGVYRSWVSFSFRCFSSSCCFWSSCFSSCTGCFCRLQYKSHPNGKLLSFQLHECAEKCSPACPSALCHCLSHLLTNSETLQGLAAFLSSPFSATHGNHNKVRNPQLQPCNNSDKINETPKNLCASFLFTIQTADLLNTHTVSSIRSRLLTCKRMQALLHAKEQGSLHSLLPRITITEYLSTHLLPETKEHGKNVARYEI